MKRSKKVKAPLILMIVSFICFGCMEINSQSDIKNDHFQIMFLDEQELYYRYPLSNYIGVDIFDYESDDSGVELSRYLDVLYYNPVIVSARGLNFYDKYINIPDSINLDYALKHRNALIDIMDTNGFFEYRVNYHHFDIDFINPWYSGMAQGLALSFFTFLAHFEQDSISRDFAHKVFKTLDPSSLTSDGVIYIDTNDFAWIEEYPANFPDHTFNGFMFAIIGIYDYYRLLNNNKEVEQVLSEYLTTIRHNMYSFRNPGSISYYCLRHKHTDRTYHRIHIRQLKYFTEITQDSSFAIFADTLKSDYWDW